MTEILNRVLPILILLAVGVGMRRVGFVAERTVDDLRKIVVNLALPAVLFTAFLEVELESDDLVVVATTFVVSILLYVAGRLLQPRFGAAHEYFPFLMTGFEAGMLGISLFGSAYGLSKVGFIAVVDLGHELFIWFVFLALLISKRDGITDRRRLVGSFFTSPVVVAILIGVGANLLDLGADLERWPITGGLLNALGLLAALTVPLILLIVGFGIQLDQVGMREAATPVAIRLAITLPLALVLPPLLFGGSAASDEFSRAALFTLLILPPPFIIPLYMKEGIDDERRYVNNVLSLYTLVSIAVFIGYLAVNPL